MVDYLESQSFPVYHTYELIVQHSPLSSYSLAQNYSVVGVYRLTTVTMAVLINHM
nr:MAG TPA: hypothetical protein [Caudoviricetes sp.]